MRALLNFCTIIKVCPAMDWAQAESARDIHCFFLAPMGTLANGKIFLGNRCSIC
jgi:hypothetical protein